MTIFEFIRETTATLAPRYGEREAGSIAWLLAEALGGITQIDAAVDPARQIGSAELDRAVVRIAGGEPVQYVLGRAWFCGLEMEVGPGVLIPRPETEELVEWIASQHDGQQKVIDIGTGSGAIAVALASRQPAWQVTATDVSPQALEIALRNGQRNGVEVDFRLSDILQETPGGRFDIAVSNPPYIPERERRRMADHVTGHEPSLALFVPDDDPLRFYRAIVERVDAGWYYFEVHERYARDVCKMLMDKSLTGIVLREDIHGKERMVRCRKA